jgi:hypothetical protein
MRACGPDPDLSSKRTWKMCVIDAWTYYSGHVVTSPAGRVNRLKCAWDQLKTTTGSGGAMFDAIATAAELYAMHVRGGLLNWSDLRHVFHSSQLTSKRFL